MFKYIFSVTDVYIYIYVFRYILCDSHICIYKYTHTVLVSNTRCNHQSTSCINEFSISDSRNHPLTIYQTMSLCTLMATPCNGYSKSQKGRNKVFITTNVRFLVVSIFSVESICLWKLKKCINIIFVLYRFYIFSVESTSPFENHNHRDGACARSRHVASPDLGLFP